MNIALIGYGKMGKEIEKIAINRGHKVGLIIDKNNPEELNAENLKDIDVAIEFSMPESALNNYIKCFNANVPVVSGTTGWLKDLKIVTDACQNGKGFFYASNFSLGVNLFFELNKKVASLMSQFPDYKVDMEEIHHIHKIDSPSGTAITLAEGIIETSPNVNGWTENFDHQQDEINIISKRYGAVPGTHTITWHSEVDQIQIQHQAYNRKGFAMGAVLAAEFMPGKEGFFGMADLLSI